MDDFFALFAHLLATITRLMQPRGYRAVLAESMLLRHQLLVLNRRYQRSPELSRWDRLWLGFFSGLLPRQRINKIAVVLKPGTLLSFHRALVKRKYQQLYSRRTHRTGPKGPSAEVIAAIIELKQRNPRFGCLRIAEHINHVFGVTIDKDVVRRVLQKHHAPTSGGGGPSWLTFLSSMKDSLWSMDFFRCESAALRSYSVMVVMDVFSRRIIGFAAVQGQVTGKQVCAMFARATQGHAVPDYLSSDNDPLFRYLPWKQFLQQENIREIKSIPYTPVSHPFVERLIGTVRREYLDHTLFFGQRDLERKLNDFKVYYNHARVHQGINGLTPMEKAENIRSKPIDINHFVWEKHCNGLFQTPIAA